MSRSSFLSAPRPFAFFCLVALVAGCATGHAPGSVPQGDACEYDVDCAPVAGGFAQCACSSGSSGPVCSAEFMVPFGCGDAGTICSASETCVLDESNDSSCQPSAPLGQSCGMVNCLPGLFCNATGTCETAHAVGQSCVSTDQTSCAAPAFCDLMTATCASLRTAGQACDSEQLDKPECVDGTSCAFTTSTCVTPEPNGSPCTDDTGCLSSFCSPDHTCATEQCLGPGGGD